MDRNNRRAVLFIATMSSFLTPFMGSAVNIALPSIGKEFKLDAITLSWVATAYILASAMFLVPIGKLADIHGRKKLFTYGVVGFTIASTLSAFSTSGEMLIAFRVANGIAAAMIFGTALAILTSVYPVGERGKALGINVAAVYIGLSMGPSVGGFLTEHLGWRSIFLVNLLLGLLIIIPTLWKLKGEWAEAIGERFDLIGSAVYGLALVAIMYGFSELPAIEGAALVGVGLLALAGFVVWETTVKNPLIDMNLFRRNAVFAFSNLAALINYSATFGVGLLLSLDLQYTKGLRPDQAGIILVSQPVVMAVFSPFAGRLSDRMDARIVASIGMGFPAVGLFLFSFLSETTPVEYIVAGLVLVGFGLALFSSPNTNAVMSSVERKYLGVASATIGTMRLTGQMLSMGIVMLIFAVYIGHVQIARENFEPFMAALRVAFSVFSGLCVLGVFASLARGRVR